MPIITIQNTPIAFPNTGTSPSWSPAVIQFAEAVEVALSAAIGDFDVPPQVYTLSSNANANLNIPNLSFDSESVRSITIEYALYRTTVSSNTYAKGRLNIMYDDFTTSWYMQREDDIGNITTEATFNITTAGQVQITTTTLAGSDYSGTISFYAKTNEKE